MPKYAKVWLMHHLAALPGTQSELQFGFIYGDVKRDAVSIYRHTGL